MDEESGRIGTVTIIISDRNTQAIAVNEILGRHGEMIIGRLGLPYGPRDIHIISLIIHGSTDEIGALTGRLGALPGVEVKSALTRI